MRVVLALVAFPDQGNHYQHTGKGAEMILGKTQYQVGDRVRVVRNIDLQPYTTVHVGEHGTVVYVGEEETNIEMDLLHKGLAPWGNCIWIIPSGMTDDVANALVAITVEETCISLSDLLCFWSRASATKPRWLW